MNSKISFYSTDWCGDCFRSKALLKKHNVSFTEINVDKDLEANEYIKVLQNQQRRIPTIVFEDGSFLVEPSDPELEQKLKDLNLI
jgi:glutaredoxin